MSDSSAFILDERRLGGLFAVRRSVSPRMDLVVPCIDALERAIGRLCQLWGGATCLLIPPTANGDPDPIWMAAVGYEGKVFKQAQGIPAGAKHGQDDLPSWTAEPLLGLVVARQTNDFRPRIRVALPDRDSPWYGAYLGALGTLPDSPDPAILDRARLVSGLKFEQLLDMHREIVTTPSLRDLLARLGDRAQIPPRLSSLWDLAANPASWWDSMKGRLPVQDAAALAAGPHIIVVYEPGSVADLCLDWDLRSIHAGYLHWPIAVPVGDETWETDIQEVLGRRGLPGRPSPVILTSASVDPASLDAIASRHPGWATLPFANLLRMPMPAELASQEVAVFNGGITTVPVLAQPERDLLRRFPGTHLRLSARFELVERRLPPIKSLEHEYGTGPSKGGFETPIQQLDEMVNVEWPSGWKVLEAAVRDRGLVAVPSAPGRAAVTLLKRLGGIAQVEYLLSAGLLETLYELCELRSMSWFRTRVRELRAASAGGDVTLEESARRLEAIVSRAADDERTDATFDKFKKVLANRRETASAWISWAERAGLIVRGTQVRCDQCGASQWRAVAEISAAMVCRNCGEVMIRPFPPDQLRFTYRAGPSLLAATEHDALPHLLALRWFYRLFKPWPAPRGDLYGGHPGVELRNLSGETVAEVDVLLLFANGDLVPGEVKRTGRGLTEHDLNMLDLAAGRLKSPWSFIATPDRAANCSEMWQGSHGDSPPRFVLSGEQLLDQIVHWSLAEDPLAWRMDTDDEWAKRDQLFAEGLPTRVAWDEQERLPGRFTEGHKQRKAERGMKQD